MRSPSVSTPTGSIIPLHWADRSPGKTSTCRDQRQRRQWLVYPFPRLYARQRAQVKSSSRRLNRFACAVCMPRPLDAGGFPIDAEYRAQGIGYLAQSGSRPGGLYQ